MTERCPHGSSYKGGCKCDVCRAWNTQHMRDVRRRQAARSWGVVYESDRLDPEPAMKALWDARNNEPNLTFEEMGRVTGVAKETLRGVYNNEIAYVLRRTHDRIMAAYGPDAYVGRMRADGQSVPWDEYRWKVHGLYAQGWRKRDLADVLKSDGRSAGWLDHMSRKQLQLRTAKQIDWLVETIGDRQGPSNRTKLRMRKRGIFPLIHYTEDGKLIRGSLTPEQRDALQQVRSNHGSSSGGGHGPRPLP